MENQKKKVANLGSKPLRKRKGKRGKGRRRKEEHKAGEQSTTESPSAKLTNTATKTHVCIAAKAISREDRFCSHGIFARGCRGSRLVKVCGLILICG